MKFGVFSFMNIVFVRYFEGYKLPEVRVISTLYLVHNNIGVCT